MKCVCPKRPSLNQTRDEGLIECDVFDAVQTIKAKIRSHTVEYEDPYATLA